MTPPLVLLAGLPGTGKSTLAQALAQRTGGHVLDKDPIRKALFGSLVEYTAEQDDFVAGTMFSAAEWLHRRHPQTAVFLDGRTWSRAYQRESARGAAAGIGRPLRIIECVCPPEIAVARLERDRLAGLHPAANRDAALYWRVRSYFEPIAPPKLEIDTTRPLEEQVELAIEWLGLGGSTAIMH